MEDLNKSVKIKFFGSTKITMIRPGQEDTFNRSKLSILEEIATGSCVYGATYENLFVEVVSMQKDKNKLC